MHCSLLLLLLVSLGGSHTKETKFQVHAAIPTQIEEPPAQVVIDVPEPSADGSDAEAEEEEEEEDGWDIKFTVNRPTSPPDEDEDDDDTNCERNYENEGEGDKDCVVVGDDPAPYTKYKSYAKWEKRPLFVIILGGLRWDYLLPEDGVPNPAMRAFNWIRKHGTTMSQVVPVFPPYDLPTWTSLATGLYPQTTGVVGDYMFNLKTRAMFNRDDKNASLDGWWKTGEPIWSVAAKKNRTVSVLNWHDCTLPGKGIETKDKNVQTKDICTPFDKQPGKVTTKKGLTKLLNKALTKITRHKYDLSVVYLDNLKSTTKKYGPNSPEVFEELQSIDEVLQGRLSDIKNKKEKMNLQLNVLLLSDYGLNGVNKTTKVVLDDYLNFNHVQYIIQRGGSTVLVPYALKAGDIMAGVGGKLGVANMIGIYAYVRDINLEIPQLDYPEIPDDLMYGGLQWTQDILLVAKPGFQIQIMEDSHKIFPPLNDDLAESGYNPQPPKPYIIPGRAKHKKKEVRERERIEMELYDKFAHKMKTIGFAWGPDFKPGFTSDPIEIVDLYQIMSFLLKVPPNKHDGDWNRVRKMLTISGAPSLSLVHVLPMITLVLLRLLA